MLNGEIALVFIWGFSTTRRRRKSSGGLVFGIIGNFARICLGCKGIESMLPRLAIG